MLSDSIRATREHLTANRETVSEGLLMTLQAYEILARDLENRVLYQPQIPTNKPLTGSHHEA